MPDSWRRWRDWNWSGSGRPLGQTYGQSLTPASFPTGKRAGVCSFLSRGVEALAQPAKIDRRANGTESPISALIRRS